MGAIAVSTEHIESAAAYESTNYRDLEFGPMPKKGLATSVLGKWVEEVRYQPAWRNEADIEADFYDGNQLDSNTLAGMEERGIPPLIRNYIKPAIDAVLGMEAKNRTDIKILPDNDEDEEFAEALNVKHHEAARIAKADKAISDAYANEVKVGLHWTEVSRETNPFRPKYRVKAVHRREIWWDWLSKEPDLSDARYLIRKRWCDTDILKLMFPQFHELIDNVASGWTTFDYTLREEFRNTWLARAYDVEENYSIEEMEYISPERDRVMPYEVWYRKWMRGMVLRDPKTDLVVELDKKNNFHLMAIQNGLVQVEEAVYPKMRLAWFLGPHRLADMPSPYPHNDFPYVPFWGNREDRTGAPYGLIRTMKSPQEESNARLSKMMWLLSARRVVADEDAVHDKDALAAEIARADAIVWLNKNRINKTSTAFQVDDNVDLSRQQFDVMQDAKQSILDTGGVYNQMMGKDVPGGATSGVAIENLVEQGAITLAEMNDNYAYARTKTHELLLSLVKEDIGRDEMEVVVGRNTGRQRSVFLNKWEPDENGRKIKTNNVAHIKTRVDLEEVPNTTTYRRQMLNSLTEITKALPPDIQAVVMPMVIEATDYPRKREMADQVRKAIGIQKPLDQMTPEEQQQVQEAMQKADEDEQFQKELQALQLAEAQAKVEKAEAEAELAKARSEKTTVEAAKIEQDTDHGVDTHALDVASRAKELSETDEESDDG
ncbi:MAG TPA: portal protein [Gammaproteobacteria bacterium]|nr:portal protein [Gammaproteobacteria bacterium]